MPRLMRLCDLLDPKHLGESCSRRHGQVSPDVTHVAVEKLISKGGHATIVSTGEDKNDGWLVAGGALYSVDLKTGKAAMVGKIEGLSGNLVDIAWID